MPVLIPPVYPAEKLPALLQRLDGVLLIGGGDIDPNLYGGEPHPGCMTFRLNGIP